MHTGRRIVATAALATALTGSVLGQGVAAAPSPPAAGSDGFPAAVEPGRIVIGWEPSATGEARSAVLERHGLSVVETLDSVGAVVVRTTSPALADLVTAVQGEAGVAYAEPDFVLEAQSNDPGYTSLWGLHNTGQSGGTADVDVDGPEAWTTTRGASDLVVAVIDTGVDVDHPDLAGNIWTNADEIAGNGVDDDGNGYVDDVHGWDFVSNDSSVYDSSTADQHGTHVAGTIAALADNGVGIAGVAPRVKIMPLKFLAADGSGSSSSAAAAVAYAHANGATVLNASWGGGDSTTLRNAIKAATGAVLVAAAGNSGVDVDATNSRQFPAGWAADSYGVGNIVSVTAVNRYGQRSTFANHGATSVDVAAPGEAILSTLPAGAYGTASGTSMAAPHVSGVAALVASVAPAMTGTELVDAVKSGVVPLSSVATSTTTGGLVNGPGALLAASSTATEPVDTGGDGSSTTDPGDGTADDGSTEGGTPAPYDGTGARSLDWACPGVTTSGFADVPTTSVHAPGVGCSLLWELVGGTAPGQFSPGVELTRAQLASILARAIRQATGSDLPAGTDRFTDDDGSVHEPAIDALAALGIVGGTGPGSYSPSASVTRGQFASMLARTYDHLAGSLPTGPDAFGDDEGSVHEPAIDGLASIGVVAGTGGGSYQPNAALPRAQAATLVARLVDALVEAGVAVPLADR